VVSFRRGIWGVFFNFHLSLSQVYHEATIVGMMKKQLSRSIFSCEHHYYNG